MTVKTTTIVWIVPGAAAMLAGFAACTVIGQGGEQPGGGATPGNPYETGSAEVAVVALAASNAACLEFEITGGGKTVRRGFDVAPESSTTFLLSGLPAASDTFSAAAYGVSCAPDGGPPAAMPTWVSNQVTVAVVAGSVESVSLVMTPTRTVDGGAATVHVDFAQCLAQVTEFAIPTTKSNPNGITTGPDGNLWFTENSGNKVGVITPSGIITEYAVPTPSSDPWGITAGPDGNLWFVESTGNKVGTITTGGSIREFAVPTANAGPRGIAAGPDGNLWFAEYGAGKIGRITTAGAISEFVVPSGQDAATFVSDPFGIVAGADGNLWFADQGTDQLGQVTVGGVITELAMPAPAEPLATLAPGPDGNLWLAPDVGQVIIRASTQGVGTPLTIPGPASHVLGIAAGPDGNLWFTEGDANQIAQVTPAGVFAEFTIPTPASSPYAITSGPDGNVWFTEVGGNNIGRIQPYIQCPGDAGVDAGALDASVDAGSLDATLAEAGPGDAGPGDATADVEPSLIFTPGTLNFGTFGCNQAPSPSEQTMTITSSNNAPFDLFVACPEYFRITAPQLGQLSAGQSSTIEVDSGFVITVYPIEPPGTPTDLLENLSLSARGFLTSGPSEVEEDVIGAELAYASSSLSFSDTCPGSSVTESITLNNTGNASATVELSQASDAGDTFSFPSSVTVGANSSVTISISFDPADYSTSYSDSIFTAVSPSTALCGDQDLPTITVSGTSSSLASCRL